MSDRDAYGDLIFTVMPKPAVKRLDVISVYVENLDKAMHEQRVWFLETQVVRATFNKPEVKRANPKQEAPLKGLSSLRSLKGKL